MIHKISFDCVLHAHFQFLVLLWMGRVYTSNSL